MPLSIGVAVLRHNLYDIDRLISRTVAYGVVTALLAATYLTLVVVLRAATTHVHGDLTVAASTLAVAALFNPVRRWVQRVVDRRFNRAHYDATRTVEAFAERLRTQFDARALIEDLETVVRRPCSRRPYRCGCKADPLVRHQQGTAPSAGDQPFPQAKVSA